MGEEKGSAEETRWQLDDTEEVSPTRSGEGTGGRHRPCTASQRAREAGSLQPMQSGHGPSSPPRGPGAEERSLDSLIGERVWQPHLGGSHEVAFSTTRSRWRRRNNGLSE